MYLARTCLVPVTYHTYIRVYSIFSTFYYTALRRTSRNHTRTSDILKLPPVSRVDFLYVRCTATRKSISLTVDASFVQSNHFYYYCCRPVQSKRAKNGFEIVHSISTLATASYILSYTWYTALVSTRLIMFVTHSYIPDIWYQVYPRIWYI